MFTSTSPWVCVKGRIFIGAHLCFMTGLMSLSTVFTAGSERYLDHIEAQFLVCFYKGVYTYSLNASFPNDRQSPNRVN